MSDVRLRGLGQDSRFAADLNANLGRHERIDGERERIAVHEAFKTDPRASCRQDELTSTVNSRLGKIASAVASTIAETDCPVEHCAGNLELVHPNVTGISWIEVDTERGAAGRSQTANIRASDGIQASRFQLVQRRVDAIDVGNTTNHKDRLAGRVNAEELRALGFLCHCLILSWWYGR